MRKSQIKVDCNANIPVLLTNYVLSTALLIPYEIKYLAVVIDCTCRALMHDT